VPDRAEANDVARDLRLLQQSQGSLVAFAGHDAAAGRTPGFQVEIGMDD
jgi:hypothetical protein